MSRGPSRRGRDESAAGLRRRRAIAPWATGEYMVQVGVGFDPVRLGTLDERVQPGTRVGAGHGIAERPVLAAEAERGRMAFSTGSCRYRHDHLERALRPIPLGKWNWLFASSEVGTQRVGIIQSLLVTCRLHAADPYTYLVDVLQRISAHPAKRVIELTPRMWKSLFADAPLRSDRGPHQHDPPSH